MNMVCPNAGKLKVSDWAFVNDGSSLPDWTLHLYQNDYTPDNASVLASFTESSFTGYLSVPILRSEMGAPTLESNIAYTERDTPPEFECTGGGSQTAYGWYLTSDDDDTVIFAQRFDTPRVMSTGATESIDPFRIGLKTLD
jgi:hypothetical protein